MTVLLEYIDLQLIFSSQRSCKSNFYHVCTLSHSASCKIGGVSASLITNAQNFCLICWHYADAFGFLLCPKLCWHNRCRPKVDQCVRKCAKLTGDSFLLAKLSLGDMVALEAKYYTKCLLALYNCAKKVQAAQQQISSKDDVVSESCLLSLQCILKKFVWKQAFCQVSNSLI